MRRLHQQTLDTLFKSGPAWVTLSAIMVRQVTPRPKGRSTPMAALAEKMRTISVKKLHPYIGAEISRRRSQPSARSETVRQIKDAWHEHTVSGVPRSDAVRGRPAPLRVRSSVPSPSGCSRRRRGRSATVARLGRHDADHRQRRRQDGKPIGSLGHGEMWFHTDKCYHRRPHRASFLYGIEIPSEGGHTQFSSSYAAYDRLARRSEAAARRRDGDAGP